MIKKLIEEYDGSFNGFEIDINKKLIPIPYMETDEFIKRYKGKIILANNGTSVYQEVVNPRDDRHCVSVQYNLRRGKLVFDSISYRVLTPYGLITLGSNTNIDYYNVSPWLEYPMSSEESIFE
jgi:hypothetical protein